MPSPARSLAIDILAQVEAGGVLVAELLAGPEPSRLDVRERAFLHELVLGSLRHRGALDHALAALLDRPLSRADTRVLAILRLGAYQLLRLRVPARAAVDEAVELAHRRAPRAASFVNAVLRRLAREGAPRAPDPGRDPGGWLGTEGSLPPWLAQRWMRRLGAEVAVARARALLEPPDTVFRLNPRTSEGPRKIALLSPLPRTVPGALLATAGRAVELASQGDIYVQDEGSQLVAHLAAADGMMLDACAAPGGKATLMADVQPQSLVVAAEASLPRLATLAGLVRKWGAPNVACVAADVLRPPFGQTFAAVLLDAPCTGLGTIARHPDIRWRVSEAEITRQAARQRAMIVTAAGLVAPGGRLTYATCSSEPEENEDVVAGFLATRGDFALAPLPEWAGPFADSGFARTKPEAGQGGAFFAAVLRREG
jgi:16S rRNA (cytosine967-C5)-methyltransferase